MRELLERLGADPEVAEGVEAFVSASGSPATAASIAEIVDALDQYKSSREAHALAVSYQGAKAEAAKADAAARRALHVGLCVMAGCTVLGALAAPVVMHGDTRYFWAFFALAALTSLALVGRVLWPAAPPRG